MLKKVSAEILRSCLPWRMIVKRAVSSSGKTRDVMLASAVASWETCFVGVERVAPAVLGCALTPARRSRKSLTCLTVIRSEELAFASRTLVFMT